MAGNSTSLSLPVGTILKGNVYTYTIEEKLGQGSFGITYLASTMIKGPLGEVEVQVTVKEFFAKELDSRMSDGTVSTRTANGIAYKYAKAFKRESENLSKMNHPGIVKVLEAFEANGTCYYSMEYLSGGSLDDKVKGVGIPEIEALPYIEKIGDALSYMHGRKMMHLDLKPKNIMLKADGSPVIIDFGLSKQFDANGEPESTSSIGQGTPGYAPIEQANQLSGSFFQPTLDVYALGATLYKMLMGKTPPPSSLILNQGFPEKELLGKGVSTLTVAAIKCALAPVVADRPQSVPEFMTLLGKSRVELTPVEDDEESIMIDPAPNPAPNPTTSKSAGKMHKTWLWVLLSGVIVFGSILTFVLGNNGEHGKDSITQINTDTAITDIMDVVDSEVEYDASIGNVGFGSARISSYPSGAVIWLDGKNTNQTTPQFFEEIASGKHSIMLAMDGYDDYSGVITISSGQRSDIFQTLSIKETSAVGQAQTAVQNPTPSNSLTGVSNGHEWVDLGLPSGLKWATCNIGASSPEEYGDYFSWGEISPKSEYTWENYKFRISGDMDANMKFSKYSTNNSYGTVDNKTRLEMSDDAARANWGSSWRMPTRSEFIELRTNCTWTWTTSGGKKGYRVSSKSNGNSIFMPAAGSRYRTTVDGTGASGNYWSSTLDKEYPFYSYFFRLQQSSYFDWSNDSRYRGFSVRPVIE